MAACSGGDWQNVAVGILLGDLADLCYMRTGERPLGGLGRSMYVHKVYEYGLPVLGTVIRFGPNTEVVDCTGPGLIVLLRILTSETERLAFW